MARRFGATPEWFIRILAGRIYLSTLLGDNTLATRPGQHSFIFLVCLAVIGTAIIVFCFAKSQIEMKLLIAFSGVLFVVSLASPTSQPYVPAFLFGHGWRRTQEIDTGSSRRLPSRGRSHGFSAVPNNCSKSSLLHFSFLCVLGSFATGNIPPFMICNL
jgi:hypothetical protein